MNSKILDPIQRSRISEQVAGRLENLIRSKKLSLDEKLPSERQLMAMLGGRSAVREAHRILAIKGYSRPGVLTCFFVATGLPVT